eukprot:19907-Amorphochlora_amoeboformis.AAC.1
MGRVRTGGWARVGVGIGVGAIISFRAYHAPAFYPVRGVLRLYALESLVSSQATTLPKPLAELSVPPQTTAIAMTGPTLLTLSNPSRGPASIEVLSTALARTSLLDPKHPEAKRARGSR